MNLEMSEADSVAIHRILLSAAEKAYAGDIDGYLSYRSKDALVIAEGQRDPLTFPQTKDFYTKVLEAIDWRPLRPLKIDEIMVSGTLAVARVTFTTEFRSKSNGKVQASLSRHFYVLRKEANGEWKIIRDIWNNVPYEGE